MKALLSTTVPPTERLLNALALLLIMSQLVLVFGYYSNLPERIPVHFGLDGRPDRWGGRANLLVVPGLSVFFLMLFWGMRQIPAEYYNQSAPLTPENRGRLVRNTHEMLAMLLFVVMVFMTWTFWNWLQAASASEPVVEKGLPIAFLLLAIAGITIFYVRRA
ncbi:uncharacterized protein DUF1648 [Larkinella arboricola]|uniref:Uncharacterized protein DUF1648 n=1 Tax=Larkinella arboricola TaxID=643671 RepID=A0A327WTN5_LARAB|nr:DUF1648 domain-containing protein [Larkinella arboricola]RAJ95674.1 uncharacterized protein DUF1648 [Larkinella arboricola]